MSRVYFEDNFYSLYLALHKDKVCNVRLDYAKSLLDLKPYLD